MASCSGAAAPRAAGQIGAQLLKRPTLARTATHIGRRTPRRLCLTRAAAAQEEVRRGPALARARRRSCGCGGAAPAPRIQLTPPAASQVPDASYDLVARNQGFMRSLPLWGGGLGFAGLLANRAISGVRGPAGNPCAPCRRRQKAAPCLLGRLPSLSPFRSPRQQPSPPCRAALRATGRPSTSAARHPRTPPHAPPPPQPPADRPRRGREQQPVARRRAGHPHVFRPAAHRWAALFGQLFSNHGF